MFFWWFLNVNIANVSSMNSSIELKKARLHLASGKMATLGHHLHPRAVQHIHQLDLHKLHRPPLLQHLPMHVPTNLYLQMATLSTVLEVPQAHQAKLTIRRIHKCKAPSIICNRLEVCKEHLKLDQQMSMVQLHNLDLVG